MHGELFSSSLVVLDDSRNGKVFFVSLDIDESYAVSGSLSPGFG